MVRFDPEQPRGAIAHASATAWPPDGYEQVCLVLTPSVLSNGEILAGVDLDKSTVPPVMPSMLLLCRG